MTEPEKRIHQKSLDNMALVLEVLQWIKENPTSSLRAEMFDLMRMLDEEGRKLERAYNREHARWRRATHA